MATCPPHGSYWTHPFFALCFVSFGPDFLFTAAQIISSNTVKPSQQGVAGSLVGTALNFGLAWGASLGGVVEAHTNDNGGEVLDGLRGAFYLGIGCCVAGIVLVLVFVRVPKDEKEGYGEDT